MLSEIGIIMLDKGNYWTKRGYNLEQKYIALIDCDSFFVSCERTLNPDLQGIAVCVTSGERGCVIARSNEAKKMGIPMGYPLFMAKKDFPKCKYITANHANYGEISQKVMSVLSTISPIVEIYSIDEAFVDLTGLSKLYEKNYYELAKCIREKILSETGIPVSIGISRTKALAKLASDKAKHIDSHICIAGKCGINKLLRQTSVDEIWGIGRRLAPKLKGLGIKTAYDYIQKNDVWIKSRFGKNGLELKYELMGNLINRVSAERKLPKSISDSRAFPEFSSDLNYIKNELMIHIHAAWRKLRKAGCKCSTVGVMLRTKDFKVYYNKININSPLNFEFEISKEAFPILEKLFNPKIIYRSVGIVLENFSSYSEAQLNLFQNTDNKKEKLAKSLDKLEAKFGRNIVRTGFTNKDIPPKQEFLTKT
jgi:nucleotidyltransferase/DNA polymerase involved in DNA repair